MPSDAKRNHEFKVRFTAAETSMIQRCAHASGEGMSEYIRDCVVSALPERLPCDCNKPSLHNGVCVKCGGEWFPDDNDED